MNKKTELIEPIESMGAKAKGKGELLKHLNNERITTKQAINAKCYDCMGYYADGRDDCKVEKCPLYPYSPYSSKPAAKRVVSKEAREQARKNLSRIRSKKAV